MTEVAATPRLRGWRLGKGSSGQRMVAFGGVVVTLFVLVALLGPHLPGVDGIRISRDRLQAPMLGSYLLGTDHLGRNGVALFIEGTQLALIIGLASAFVSFLIGVVIGTMAGYFGGWVDTLLMRFTEIIMMIPIFFLAIVIVSIAGRSIWIVVLVLGGLSWPVIARITRAEFLSLKRQDFVEGARALGARAGRIMFLTMLPNALPPVLVNTMLQVARAMLLEAYLSFLGLGDPTRFSWGLQLRFAQEHLTAWWMAVFPGLGLLLVVLGLNVLGEGMSTLMDPLRKGAERR